MTRVAFIHALHQSLAPLDEEMDRQWPDSESMHLLDSSLASDLARSPHGLDARFDARMMQLAEYAVRTGAAGILFTRSAFGRCIEYVARRLAPLPVLEPNEAMVDEAVASGGRLGPVATFAPTLTSMVATFPEGRELHVAHAAGALEALRAGDRAGRDRVIVRADEALVREGCTVSAVAQFSMARAAHAVALGAGVPAPTTVSSAVRRLRERVERRAIP